MAGWPLGVPIVALIERRPWRKGQAVRITPLRVVQPQVILEHADGMQSVFKFGEVRHGE